MGYSEPISLNPAMVLGGLKEGVSPLLWTYAYMTLANDGDRVSGTLAPVPEDSPVAFTEVTDRDGNVIKGGDNDSTHKQVIPEETAEEAKGILETVISSGTGTHAAIGAPGEWGKTGTTSESGDAWFCGSALEVTTCVWVGYAESVTSMETLYNGGPVMGGTFPALIWASVKSAWEGIQAEIAAEAASHKKGDGSSSSSSSSGGEVEEYVPPTGSTEVPEETYEAPEEAAPEEAAPAPEEAAPPAEAPAEPTGAGGGITAG
jgi:penicillin-binding protein 1A